MTTRLKLIGAAIAATLVCCFGFGYTMGGADSIVLLDADENSFFDVAMAQSTSGHFAVLRFGDLGDNRAGGIVNFDEENKVITTDMDVEITDPARGIIRRSPNGHRWRETIDNSGNRIVEDLDD